MMLTHGCSVAHVRAVRCAQADKAAVCLHVQAEMNVLDLTAVAERQLVRDFTGGAIAMTIGH